MPVMTKMTSGVDECELMSGEVDTPLSAPGFVEPSERDIVYNFAPGEGQIPISVYQFYARGF